MKPVYSRLTDYLEENRIPYLQIHHFPDFTSQETASHTGTPGREFAKTVVLRIDDGFAMAVLPAHHRIDFERLRSWLSASEIRLATEKEMETLFPDCELGAEPPLGGLYELPVYVSPLLAGDEYITFNGGTHEEVIRMKYRDYARLTRPHVIHFTVPM